MTEENTSSNPPPASSTAERLKKLAANKQVMILGAVLLVALVLLVFLASVVGRGATPTSQTQPIPTKQPLPRNDTTLTAIPIINVTKTSVAVGDTFAIEIGIATGKNLVTGVQLELGYDPTTIAVTEITPGTFFDKPLELPTRHITQTGDITYALYNPDGKQGSGTVAKIKVRALKKTNGTVEILTIKPTTIVTEQKNKLSSVLKERKGASLVIR